MGFLIFDVYLFYLIWIRYVLFLSFFFSLFMRRGKDGWNRVCVFFRFITAAGFSPCSLAPMAYGIWCCWLFSQLLTKYHLWFLTVAVDLFFAQGWWWRRWDGGQWSGCSKTCDCHPGIAVWQKIYILVKKLLVLIYVLGHLPAIVL